VYKLIAKSSQCQLTALATAVLLSVTSLSASALSLGRVTVHSALGEPLRAEVDFLDINAEEAATLSARVASPDAFRAAGLEYNAALSSLKATLQRRPDGRAYLRLSGDRPVNEPFVDLILETAWNSGRIVRDYTLLFDPPSLRSATAQTPDTTQLPAQSAEPVQPAPAPSAMPTQADRNATRPLTALKPTAPAESTRSVRVQPGQTAGEIAAAHRPANVSLDQMLVALLRSNPTAFIQDNVNRIKAGAVLSLPQQQAVQAVPADEASQIVVAQSRDFSEFRRKLAGNVLAAPDTPSAREASGQVQASVQDKKPSPSTPDKLTLSKGAVQAKSGEDQLAAARNAQQSEARAAELAKNISDLNKLAASASAPADKPVQAQAPETVLSAPTASVSVSAPAVAAPAALAPSPATNPAPVTATPEPESGFIDALVADPLLPVGVVALLGLLAALGVYKRKQRQKNASVDSTYSQAVPSETLADSSGGQVIDTSDSMTSGASMVYSPSQLDAADDVDPVAEADVYLAYGRDLQAEEILKDALRKTPDRVAVHAKLAEIYAKRKDSKALEAIATQVFNLTNGSGPQWEQICELGLSIDPDNALYLPGGQPRFSANETVVMDATTKTRPIRSALDEIAAAKAAADAVTSRAGALEDLDLDLDFSLEEPSNLADAVPEAPVQPTAPTRPVVTIPGVDVHTMPGALDFNTEPAPFDPVSKLAALHEELPDEVAPPQEPKRTGGYDPDKTMVFDRNVTWTPSPAVVAPEPVAAPEPTAAFSVETPKTEQAEPQPAEAPAEAPPAVAATDMLSFDIDSLSLDLADDKTPAPAVADEPALDPLETKLALAEEFRAIGDEDGARALIEEVISEATGPIKAKAQQALSKL